ncbi:sulfurtransferase complex subunit TusD [Thaumasiovibrio subtropicus]|uniref:sulfurtransferase complex subunit TusD n=1 Tax=Thaumasiovibrio subtropicus TaxID=1891207 RepID=UPI000B34E3C5|nr:sulfurtransferase complex subunit TusD [Thaumasiovibrio subtropicus]
MSLTYALVINGPAYGTQAARTAYGVALAVIEGGHKLSQIFFYQDGVHNASALTAPASDEFDLVAAWQTLASVHQVELHTCIAAALRRGVVSDIEASQEGLPASNMAEGFTQSGLGVLAESLLTADRVLQF